jgi:hypothetical protein
MQNATTNNTTVQLQVVAADYKLGENEQFLIRGRKNSQQPAKPYYHTILKATAVSMPPLPLMETAATTRAAMSKLWAIATMDFLKEKAAGLDAGATISLALTAADVLSFIADIGNRERATISGEELDAFTSSYAFTATGLVHNWNASQVARVATALRQYAAPAHRKPVADATILLARLEALPSLLTGDDSALDADIIRVFQWLAAKLKRDTEQQAANLADSI